MTNCINTEFETDSDVATIQEISTTFSDSARRRLDISKGRSNGGKTFSFVDGKHSSRGPKYNVEDATTPMILHVDDDVDLVQAVTARLQASGLRVASATDGISGLRSALLYCPNAIILDYDMPNGRGDKVIELLKSNDKTEHVPIVVLTAVHKKGLERHLRNKGADAFMTKPFRFEELKETVLNLV